MLRSVILMNVHCTSFRHCMVHRGPSSRSLYLRMLAESRSEEHLPLCSKNHYKTLLASNVELEMNMGTDRLGSPPAES